MCWGRVKPCAGEEPAMCWGRAKPCAGEEPANIESGEEEDWRKPVNNPGKVVSRQTANLLGAGESASLHDMGPLVFSFSPTSHKIQHTAKHKILSR